MDDQPLTDPVAPATTIEWTQAKFMQNLAGKNSIIGKSIVVTRYNSASPDSIHTVGCCVIGDARPPVHATTTDTNANAAYAHSHQHQPSNNHGNTGTPQYGQYTLQQAQYGHSHHSTRAGYGKW